MILLFCNLEMKDKLVEWFGFALAGFLIIAGAVVFVLNYKFFGQMKNVLQFGMGYPILCAGIVCLILSLHFSGYLLEKEEDE